MRWLVLLLFSVPLWGQASFYQFPVPLPGATFRVCPVGTTNPCPSPASIFSDQALTQSISQPAQTGVTGQYAFWVQPGQYTIQIGQPYNFVYVVNLGGGGTIGISTSPGAGVSQNIVQQLATDFSSNIDANVRKVTPSWNWSQSIASTLTGGVQATVTLAPCPLGIDTTNFSGGAMALTINSGAEQAIITGGSCTSGAATGTVIFTPVASYGNPFTLGSASGGLQEAVNDACRGTDYTNGSIGGNCEVDLMPSGLFATPSYTVLAPVYIHGRNTWQIHVKGHSALIRCSTRSVCLFLGNRNSSGAGGEISDVGITNTIALDGAQISDVTAASGTFTVHTASAHNLSMTANAGNPDYAYVNFYVNATGGSLRGIFPVTSVADSTHFTFVNGSTTFSNASGFGWVRLQNTMIEDNLDGSLINNVRDISVASSPGPSFFIVDDNDQNMVISNIRDTPTGTTNTANFVGYLIYARGDNGNAGIVTLKDSEISPQCNGNGVLAVSGNGFIMRDSVVQGFDQAGIYSANGLVNSTLDSIYEESTGACNNPQAPAGAQRNQVGAFITGGSNNKIGGTFPLNGTYPNFNAGGGSRFNYYVVYHVSGGSSVPLPIGVGEPVNGSTNVVVSFPYVALGTFSPTTVNFDLLAVPGTTTTPVTGTGSWAVATAQTCTPNTNGWCSFTDTQGARSSYTVAAGSNVNLWYWPGFMVLSSGSTAVMDIAPTGITSTRGAQVSVIATGCSTGSSSNFSSISAPATYSCLASDPLNGTGSQATLLQQPDPGNNTTQNSKGRLNFGGYGNLIGGSNSTHIITVVDVNPGKTAGTAGHRPANDANDTFIGVDNAGSGANFVGMSLGAPNDISQYIGNIGDGTNWKEQLTTSSKTFKVPVTMTQTLGVTGFLNLGTSSHINTTSSLNDEAGTTTCSGTIRAVNFSTNYTNTPVVVATGSAGTVRISAINNTGFTVTCSSTNDTFFYIVMGAPN